MEHKPESVSRDKPLEDQSGFFDRLITEEWDSYSNPAWDAARRLEVAEIMAVARPRRILDVGCGCGFHDREMAQVPGVESVLGIDYSTHSVKMAEYIYPHPKVRRIAADIRSLSDGPFDLVVSFQVIEHFPDSQDFLNRCANLTAPGGWTAVVTPNGAHLENRIRRALGRRTVLRDPQHFTEFTLPEVEAMGRRAGLRSIASFGHGLSLPLPGLSRALPGPTLGRWLGRMMPRLADVIGVVFQKQ